MNLSLTTRPAIGHRLALGGSAFLTFHSFLAGLRVECDHLAVERGHERSCPRRSSRRGGRGRSTRPERRDRPERGVLPLDRPALLRQVEGVHVVGVRAVDVHRRADDERLSLVAAEGAGGEGPDLPEIGDVPRGDLLERSCSASTSSSCPGITHWLSSVWSYSNSWLAEAANGNSSTANVANTRLALHCATPS